MIYVFRLTNQMGVVVVEADNSDDAVRRLEDEGIEFNEIFEDLGSIIVLSGDVIP